MKIRALAQRLFCKVPLASANAAFAPLSSWILAVPPPPDAPSGKPQFHWPRPLQWAITAVVLAGLFVADTLTHYEVASAVFYIVLMLVLARTLAPRRLVALTALCMGLTVLSFALTQTGDQHSGLINLAISLCAMVLTCVLLLKIKSAQAAAQDAQAQLIRLARIQSLEGLTSAIAHEINQPLAAIVTSGNACQRWLGQEPPNVGKAHDSLARILADAGRASSIIARVRSLSRAAPAQRSPFGFHEALQEVLDLAQGELTRQGIALTLALEGHSPQVLGDRVQIQQVISNLLLNAIEALASGPAENRQLWVGTHTAQGQVSLTVCDNGPGLPAEGAYIFDAFWTTKDEGTGIGLSISRSITEAHGGSLIAEMRPEGGAIFRFSLPALPQEPSP